MEPMKMAATKYSPLVELSEEGKMVIRGRSILEDPIPFYNTIMGWISQCKSKTFTVDIQLEYLNTCSTKVIHNLLMKIKESFNSNCITINWYYESDDDDMLELGKDFESLICLPIDFYELTVEIA